MNNREIKKRNKRKVVKEFEKKLASHISGLSEVKDEKEILIMKCRVDKGLNANTCKSIVRTLKYLEDKFNLHAVCIPEYVKCEDDVKNIDNAIEYLTALKESFKKEEKIHE